MNLIEIEGLIHIIKESGLNFVEIKTDTLYVKTMKNENELDKKINDKKIENKNTFLQYEDEKNIEFIKSPLVGVFRRNKIEDIKSNIEKGQVVAFIEAMKIINEISSPCDGEILEFLVEDDQIVEYGEKLIKLKKF